MILLNDIVDDCLDHGCVIEIWSDRDGLHTVVSNRDDF